jgi:hypothetical protein
MNTSLMKCKLALGLMLGIVSSSLAQPPANNLTLLLYYRPADKWAQALPKNYQNHSKLS